MKNKKYYRMKAARRRARRGYKRHVSNPLEWAIHSVLDLLEDRVSRSVDAVATAIATAWRKRRSR